MIPTAIHPNLKNMPPAYFALAMATGIVSIALNLHGFTGLAKFLFAVNILQYAILWGALVLRVVRFRTAILSDASDHLRAPGYFTIIAATGVLCTQSFVVAGWIKMGFALAIFTFALWLILLYAIFALLIVKPVKPPIEKGINGGWLVAIVATQSVAIVSTQMAKHFQWNEDLLLFGGLLSWNIGIMLYLWIISLIFYRYMFFPFEPGDLSPPYWINMGAVAISTLAGCGLIAASGYNELLLELRPFLKGVTFLLWATATWWIPMLLMLGYWRHVLCRFPIRYDPMYWGMVFPLGMYSTCTFHVAREFGQVALYTVAAIFLCVASVVWLLVFSAMLMALARSAFADQLERQASPSPKAR